MSEDKTLDEFLFKNGETEHYKTRFEGLLNGYGTLRKILREQDKKEAEKYNLFDILNIESAETKTHTPFLANLLNTNGTHGQQNLFLTSFINTFIPESKRNNFLLTNTNDYWIKEEHPFSDGRIDILIRANNTDKKFGFILEIKLNAGDQENQITRYHTYLHSLGLQEHEMIIFYLTIDGKDPTAFSIDPEKLLELKEKNIFFNISYRKDILGWLQNLLPQIQARKVTEIIKQYMDTIQTL